MQKGIMVYVTMDWDQPEDVGRVVDVGYLLQSSLLQFPLRIVPIEQYMFCKGRPHYDLNNIYQRLR